MEGKMFHCPSERKRRLLEHTDRGVSLDAPTGADILFQGDAYKSSDLEDDGYPFLFCFLFGYWPKTVHAVAAFTEPCKTMKFFSRDRLPGQP